MDTKKLGIRLSIENFDKLNKISDKLLLSKSKIIEVLLRKLELNTIKDDFDFYNIKVKK
jgi:hypothetical protein